MVETLRFYRGRLPHWLVADATYFVTIRLRGTLPRDVRSELASERATLQTQGADEDAWTAMRRRHFRRIENILDACDNTRVWLADKRVAAAMLKNLAWLRGRGWTIYAAVVMPNHLHLLIRNARGQSAALLDDLAQFKCFTARRANAAIGRTGAFWAREDFDHWIRSSAKLDGTVRYIANNPVKAGLVERWDQWPWVTIHDDMLALLRE